MQTPDDPSPSAFEKSLLVRRLWSAWLAGIDSELDKLLLERPELSEDHDRLAELAYAELWFRKQLDASVDEREYIERFPEIATAFSNQLALIIRFDSYLQNLRATDLPPVKIPQGPATNNQSANTLASDSLETKTKHSSPGQPSPNQFNPHLNPSTVGLNAFNADKHTHFGGHGDSTVAPAEVTIALHEEMAPYGFEPICLLGVGGMGVVVKAIQRSLNREVAVKSLKCGQWIAKTNRERLLKEAHVVALLKHPHVVQIYDVIEELGKLFLVMEYVQGRSLSQEIDAKPIEPMQSARYIRDVASAIEAAHSAGFLHRDIKPTNILLSAVGEIKVTDFGLARATEQSTMSLSGELLGTPAYMAPEQIKGDRAKVDVRADVYGIGATLYELLTGRPPFMGSSTAETLQQVLLAEPIPPRRLVQNLPQDIESICLQCLEKSPDKRYSTVAELKQDVERFLTGKPTLARPVTKIEKARRWVRHNPVQFLSSLGLTVSIVTLMVATTWYLTHVSYLESVGLSRDEALRQARSRESLNSYYSLVSEIQTRISDRYQGWTWKNQEDLRQAAKLIPDANERTRLRELLIQSLGGFDLKKDAVVASGIDPYGLAWSPDGQRLVIGENVTRTLENGDEGYILYVLHEWPSRTLKEIILPALDQKKIADGLVEGVRALVFIDSRHVAVGCRSGWVLIVDVDTGEVTSKWKAHEDWCYCFTYDRERNRLISGSRDSSVAIWDATTYELISRFHSDQFVKFIEVVGDELVCLGEKHWVFSLDNLAAPQPTFKSSTRASIMRKMPDGKTLLVAANDKIMSANSHFEEITDFSLTRTPFTRSRYLSHLDVSTYGNWIATSGVETAVFLNARNHREVMAIPIPGAGANYVTFDRCGDALWVTNNYQLLRYDLHLPELWQSTSDATTNTYPVENSDKQLDLSPQFREREFHIQVNQRRDDQRLARGRIVIANMPADSTTIEQAYVAFDNASANFPPAALASINDDVMVWDAKQSELRPSGLHFEPDRLQAVTAASLSHDGQHYWVGDIVNKVSRLQVLNVSDGELLYESFNNDSSNRKLVGAFESFSCGPTRTLALSSDYRLSVYDSASLQFLKSIDLGSETTPKVAALSDDERIAFVGAQEGHVLAIELETGKIEKVMDDLSEVTALSTSPEGVLAVGFHAGEIEFWSTTSQSLQRLARLPRMENSIQCLEFSLDGSQLAVLVQGERAGRLLDWNLFRNRLGEFGLDWNTP